LITSSGFAIDSTSIAPTFEIREVPAQSAIQTIKSQNTIHE
jgi:hypothetical protein